MRKITVGTPGFLLQTRRLMWSVMPACLIRELTNDVQELAARLAEHIRSRGEL